ncbi:MAG: hypothetical protein ACHQ49_10385 [Elusimicrobiota bacterium]
MLLPMIVVALLAVPGARAQAPMDSTLPFPKTKLDWPLFSPFSAPRETPEQPYYSGGFGLRFGGESTGWSLFGNSVEGALFSLAVINAFIPRWLPKGTSRS